MSYEIVGDITQIETIAVGARIRELFAATKAVRKGSLAEDEGGCDGSIADGQSEESRIALV